LVRLERASVHSVSFGAGVGGLLPSFTNITSWLKTPTADGKTLDNSKGADATFTGVNCVDFDGSGDRVAVDSAGGINLLTNASNNLGSCVITATFLQDTAGTQVVYSNGASAYRLWTQNNYLKVNAVAIEIFAIELNKVYQSTITYNASGEVTNFVLENLTDGTTQTDSTTRDAGTHGGSGGFQIGARNGGLVWNGKISNVSVSNSSVGANIHLPLAEGSGSVAYDVSGNGANGTIIGTTWATLDGIESWNHEYGFTPAVRSTANDGSVDTGVRIDSANIVLKTRFLWRGDNQDYLFGIYNATASQRFLFYQNNTQMRLVTPNGGHDLGTTASIQDKFVDLEITSTTATLNGTTTSIDLTGVSQTADLRIFSNNVGTANADCDIQSFSIVKDGTQVINYVSAQAGKFYDRVSNSLVSGTGTLVTNNIPALSTKTKQVATFDAVADEVNFGTHAIPASDSIEVIFTPRDEADRGCLYSQGSLAGTRGYGLTWDGTNDRIFVRTSDNTGSNFTNLQTANNSCVADGTTYKVTYNYSQSAGTMTIILVNNDTGVTIDTASATSVPSVDFDVGTSRPIKIGEDQSNLDDYLGLIHSVKSSLIDVDFQANIGTTTVVDNSGNGNNGTVTVGSGGLDSFWGTRVADTAGSIVSADYAAGNTTISNPAGFVHNGSECGVAMVTNSLTSTQLFAIDNSTATETFVRKDNGNIVQILDYSAPLTGNDLARTKSYVG
jgi:hypothetical protein